MSDAATSPLIDLNAAAHLLKISAPDWEWLLREIESKDGFFRFPPEVAQYIERFKIANYPLLYQDERAIGNAFMLAFFTPSEAIALDRELTEASLEERGEFLTEFLGGVVEGVNEAENVWRDKTPEQAKAEFDAMAPEEQAGAIKSLQFMSMAFLAGFYQVLSVMVHRQKITALVAHAKAGDDSAFVKAVQIDPRILTTDPYFKQRFENLHAIGNEAFRRKLSYRMQCAPYRGKVRHKSLWMGFAFLDMCGHFETLKDREMLDLLDEAGIGGYDNRIEDVKYLNKRRNEYRQFQQDLAALSTP